MKDSGRIWRFTNARRQGIGLMLLLLVPPAFCLLGGSARADQSGQAAAARTSTYVFVPAESTVVRTGGIAGLVKKYSVKGQLRLTVDFDASTASFSQIDATLTSEDGVLYAQSLNALFNMAGLAGVPFDETTIKFHGKTADGTDSDVRLTLTFTDDSAHLAGTITPPPNSADMFFYDLNAVAIRKYAGGTGEPDTPYLIDTAEQMNAIGAEPNDWDKHFRLMADIDLDGYSGTDFNIIAPAYKGVYFTGLFDGGGHTISNFTYGPADANSVALFGNVNGRIENVGLIDPNIDAGTRDGVAPLVDYLNEGSMSGCYVRGGSVSGNEWVGGLVAYNTGTITDCFSTTAVTGKVDVGGLVGHNIVTVANCHSMGSITGGSDVGGLIGINDGTITGCSSNADVMGNSKIGGLVGENRYGLLWQCNSTGHVTGVNSVADLVGLNNGVISDCYSTGEVYGDLYVGGLVGFQSGKVFNCYSAGGVTGRLKIGGLVGAGFPEDVLGSFWDVETSGQTTSAAGIGKTTAEMQTAVTFLDAGWDFVDEIMNGPREVWQMPKEGGYPLLAIFDGYAQPKLQGQGTPDNPYLISDALELSAIVRYGPDAHYRLTADVDLTGIRWIVPVVPSLAGTFDGSGHMISHLTIDSGGYLGLFGRLESGAELKNLGVLEASIFSSGYSSQSPVGVVVGANRGIIAHCYSTGMVNGGKIVGGLVGLNGGSIAMSYSHTSVNSGDGEYGKVGGLVGYNSFGSITTSYSTGTVSGVSYVGGLVGYNFSGSITTSYSTGMVSGISYVGGLVGYNGVYEEEDISSAIIAASYSTGTVSGFSYVGGLVGYNQGSKKGDNFSAIITGSYSTGMVSANLYVGGLVGLNYLGYVNDCFWDIQTSGHVTSAGGTGKTTAEMQTAKTFLQAGWDFIGETANGTEDIWWILEGRDYPRLWWEAE